MAAGGMDNSKAPCHSSLPVELLNIDSADEPRSLSNTSTPSASTCGKREGSRRNRNMPPSRFLQDVVPI